MSQQTQKTADDSPSLDFVHRFYPSDNAAATATTTTTTKLMLLLHGTGGDENDLLPLAKMITGENISNKDKSNYAYLGVRGKVLEAGAPRFFRRLAEGVFDQQDLLFRTNELAKFIEHAAQVYGFAIDDVIALGYSNGANILASVLLRDACKLKQAILLHAMTPFEPESLPDLTRAKVLLTAGRRDPIVKPADTLRLKELLSEAKAEVELFWHDDGGHNLTREEIAAAQDWLKSKNG